MTVYRKTVRMRQDPDLMVPWFHSLLLVVQVSQRKHIDRVYINGYVGSCRGKAGPAFAAVLGSLRERRANLWPDLHPLCASFPS